MRDAGQGEREIWTRTGEMEVLSLIADSAIKMYSTAVCVCVCVCVERFVCWRLNIYPPHPLPVSRNLPKSSSILKDDGDLKSHLANATHRHTHKKTHTYGNHVGWTVSDITTIIPLHSHTKSPSLNLHWETLCEKFCVCAPPKNERFHGNEVVCLLRPIKSSVECTCVCLRPEARRLRCCPTK